jgi:hypothetical protein
VIRIDVYLAGETWYTWYVRAYDKPDAATFHVDPTELDECTAPKKKCSQLYPQPGWVAREICPSFSPITAIEVVRLSQPFVDEYATSIY